MIVAVDKNWAIGKQGRLLVRIPNDIKLFREETTGKVVIMGRKTFESLPDRAPLKDRVNIVLTANREMYIKGVLVCHSIEAAMESLKEYKEEDIFIIGGESIYKQFLPLCKTIHVTYIDYTYEADTYFPDLDKEKEWYLAEKSEEQTYFDLIYEFRKYKRV